LRRRIVVPRTGVEFANEQQGVVPEVQEALSSRKRGDDNTKDRLAGGQYLKMLLCSEEGSVNG
jgi:hypothetical protein